MPGDRLGPRDARALGPGGLAHRCDWRGSTSVAVHNLPPEPVRTTLRFEGLNGGDELLDLVGDADAESVESTDVAFELPPYRHRWMRIHRAGQRVLP